MIRSSLLLGLLLTSSVVGAATSEPIRLDLRSQVQVVESDGIQISCDPSWTDGADSVKLTVVDSTGQETQLSEVAAATSVRWLPTELGCYQIRQSYYRNGQEIGSPLVARYVLPSSATTGSAMSLDVRDGVRVVNDAQKINYDSNWCGKASDTVQIALNGDLWKSAYGAGSFDWMPTSVGRYAFTLLTDNASLYSATFDVVGPTLNITTDDSVAQGMTVRIEGAQGWAVYYTLDGSEPDANSMRYLNPFQLDWPKAIKAVAYSENGIRSEMVEQRYSFDVPYCIHFNGNGGAGTMESPTFVYGRAYALPANGFVRTGYDFAGWATNATGAVVFADGQAVSNLLTVADGEMTLFAQWSPVAYAISYSDTRDAANPNPAMYTVEDEITFAALPDVTGWRFTGWSVTEIAKGSTGDVEVVASWSPVACRMVFNGNGGAGTMESPTFVYGQAYALPANGFARTGYDFAGWATNATGAVVFADGQAVSNLLTVADGEMTLFAQWSPVAYAISYSDTRDAANPNPATYTVEDEITFAALPDVTNWVFSGWSVPSIAKGSTGEVSVAAMWTLDVQNLVFGPYVPGVAVSEILDALVGYAAKGLPAGLKFNAKTGEIYGTPAKPTASSGVTVTFTKKGVDSVSARVVVGAYPLLSIDVVGNGSVKGAGSYAANKKISLEATAAKGAVFAGWFEDASCGIPLICDVDYRTMTISYVMPVKDRTVYAKFVSASADSELALFANGREVTTSSVDVVLNAAKSIPIDINVSSWSLPKITVSGLPTGLKYASKLVTSKVSTGTGKNKVVTLVTNALPNQVYGLAAKPGQYVVTVKLSNATVKKAVERKFTLIVDNLTGANEAAYFKNADGEEVGLTNGREEKYLLTVGVSSNDIPRIVAMNSGDKISVSSLPSGIKYNAKDGSISGVATKAGTYTSYVTVKSGKTSCVSTFTIEVRAIPSWVSGTFVGTGFPSDEESADEMFCEFTITTLGAVSFKGTWSDGKSITGKAQLSHIAADGYHFDIAVGANSKRAKDRLTGVYACVSPVEFSMGVTNAVLDIAFRKTSEEDNWMLTANCIRSVWKDKNAQLPKLNTKNTVWVDVDDGSSYGVKSGSFGLMTVSYWSESSVKASASGSGRLLLEGFDPGSGWYGRMVVLVTKSGIADELPVDVTLDGELIVNGESGTPRPYQWFAGQYRGTLKEVYDFPVYQDTLYHYDVLAEVSGGGSALIWADWDGISYSSKKISLKVVSVSRHQATLSGTMNSNGAKFNVSLSILDAGEANVDCRCTTKLYGYSGTDVITGTLLRSDGND